MSGFDKSKHKREIIKWWMGGVFIGGFVLCVLLPSALRDGAGALLGGVAALEASLVALLGLESWEERWRNELKSRAAERCLGPISAHALELSLAIDKIIEINARFLEEEHTREAVCSIVAGEVRALRGRIASFRDNALAPWNTSDLHYLSSDAAEIALRLPKMVSTFWSLIVQYVERVEEHGVSADEQPNSSGECIAELRGLQRALSMLGFDVRRAVRRYVLLEDE